MIAVDIVDDRVQETAPVGGLGNYILTGSAVPGFATFASKMTVGQTTWVFCYDPISLVWEVDRVTFAAGNQLQRTEMLASSTGSPVNFPGNSCQIAMTIPAAFVLDPNSGSTYEFGTISWSGVSPAQNELLTITRSQSVNAHLLSAEFANGPGGGTIDAAVILNGTTIGAFGTIAIGGTGELTGSAEIPAGSVLQVQLFNVSGTVDGAITLSGTQD